jgi:hypothetical protein
MKILSLIAAVSILAAEIANAAPPFDTAKIDQITGLKGKWNEAERFVPEVRPRPADFVSALLGPRISEGFG